MRLGKCRFKRDAKEAILNIVNEFPDDCLQDRSNPVSVLEKCSVREGWPILTRNFSSRQIIAHASGEKLNRPLLLVGCELQQHLQGYML